MKLEETVHVRHFSQDSTRSWFIFISFHIFFPKSELPNWGCGLFARTAYTPVFTLWHPLRRVVTIFMEISSPDSLLLLLIPCILQYPTQRSWLLLTVFDGRCLCIYKSECKRKSSVNSLTALLNWHTWWSPMIYMYGLPQFT